MTRYVSWGILPCLLLASPAAAQTCLGAPSFTDRAATQLGFLGAFSDDVQTAGITAMAGGNSGFGGVGTSSLMPGTHWTRVVSFTAMMFMVVAAANFALLEWRCVPWESSTRSLYRSSEGSKGSGYVVFRRSAELRLA